MLKKEPPQLPLAYTKAFRELFYRCPITIERSFSNERESSRDRVRCSAPGGKIRRRFRPATKTWTKARILRRRCGAVKSAIFK